MAWYRILTADGKPPVAIKKGFCWPVIVLGPFWALYRKFWPAALVLPFVALAMRLAERWAEDTNSAVILMIVVGFEIAAVFCIGRYANLLLTTYLTTKGYRIVAQVQADWPATALQSALQNAEGAGVSPQPTPLAASPRR